MSDAVPVGAISRERLQWRVQDCTRDHATPLVLVAVGHDEQAGRLHVYRTEDGPSDAEVIGMLRAVATHMEWST